jgi:hypothetical protein
VGRRENRFDSCRRSSTGDELDVVMDRYGEEGQIWEEGNSKKESRSDLNTSRRSRNSVETVKEKSIEEANKSGEKIWRVKKAEKGKNIQFSNEEEIKETFPFQQEDLKALKAIAETKTFRFGDSISGKAKEDSNKGKSIRRGQRGAARIARATQKPAEPEKMVGQNGPNVAEIAALLEKHLQAQGDKPPSKKRLREDNIGEADVEGISMYGGSLSLERKKKRGDIESQLEKSTNGLAVAGDQPRRSL